MTANDIFETGPLWIPKLALPAANNIAYGLRLTRFRVTALVAMIVLVTYCFHSAEPPPNGSTVANVSIGPRAADNNELPSHPAPDDPPLATYHEAMATRTAYFSQTQTRSTKYTSKSIPPLIHMIWLGATTRPPTADRCRDKWQRAHPTWRVLFWDESNGNLVVRTHFPHLWTLYSAMPKVVMRSDWLRYMVLSVFGGIYADVDACPLKPFDKWDLVHRGMEAAAGQVPGVVVGVEMDTLRPDWRSFANRPFQIASWTLVSVPGHPLWSMILHDSVVRVERLYDARQNKWWFNVTDEVCESTGPAVVTDVTLQGYMARWGDTSGRALHGMQEGRRFGDALLLPITSFAPHAADMGARGSGDVQAYVHHAFSGSWKGQ